MFSQSRFLKVNNALKEPRALIATSRGFRVSSEISSTSAGKPREVAIATCSLLTDENYRRCIFLILSVNVPRYYIDELRNIGWHYSNLPRNICTSLQNHGYLYAATACKFRIHFPSVRSNIVFAHKTLHVLP